MIRLQVLTGTPTDLTDDVEGLTWSNVNPGGDEACSFRLKRQWFAGAPEVAQGNVIRVTDGLDVLWQGRIDENDRSVSNAEEIGVTAYGLGVRLKDDETFREIYVDRDLSRWGAVSRKRRMDLIGTYAMFEPAAASDVQNGLPALNTALRGRWDLQALCEAWYDCGPGLKWGAIYYDQVHNGNLNPADTNWLQRIYTAVHDAGGTFTDITGDISDGGSAGYATPATPERYALIQLHYAAVSGSHEVEYGTTWRKLAVYGNHGLTRRGSDPGGFYASDVIANIVGRVTGMRARRIDATTFVIPHLAFTDPLAHEAAIVETAKFESLGWGTWGPDNALDNSSDGHFDCRLKEPTVQHWYARRSQCDNVDLHVEQGYDTVDVHYRDAAGTIGIETRTISGGTVSRTARLDGGTLTQAGAQQLGDRFLALTAGQPPARGSITLRQPVRHHQRGTLPPWHMRADGSNVRLPDVLPSKDALSLSASPDRRTTFPIKRVQVDASGSTPTVTVQVDQTPQELAAIQARLSTVAQLIG